MTDEPEKTAAEKLAAAVRRKAEAIKSKGPRGPGRGAEPTGPTVASQNQHSTILKRSGSFKGR